MKKMRQIIALLLISALILGQVMTEEFAHAVNMNTKDVEQGSNESNTIASTTDTKSYTITYAPMGGYVKETSKIVYQGEQYGTLPTPELSGYTFQGWYTQEEAGVKVTETTPVTNNSSHILYARWKPISSIIRFHANGGKVNIDSKIVTYGSKYGELPTPTLEDYTFRGWYTEYSGGKQINETDITDITSEIMLYARWEGKSVNVNFNTSTDEQLNPVNVRYGNSYGDLPLPSKDSYSFLGWYLPGFGLVKSETTVTDKNNHTLYAKWQNIAMVKFTFIRVVVQYRQSRKKSHSMVSMDLYQRLKRQGIHF